MKINLKYFISIFDRVKITIGICTKVRVIWLSNKNDEKSCSGNIFRPKTLDHCETFFFSFFFFNFLSSMFLLVSIYIYIFVSFVYYYSMGISIILTTMTR